MSRRAEMFDRYGAAWYTNNCEISIMLHERMTVAHADNQPVLKGLSEYTVGVRELTAGVLAVISRS